MKCPLRKIRVGYNANGDRNYFPHTSEVRDDFRDCIESECAAWNPDDKLCNYLSGKRKVEISI